MTLALERRHLPRPDPATALGDWDAYRRLEAECLARFAGRYAQHRFDYLHPTRLQAGSPRRHRKPYTVPLAWTEWGDSARPTLLCCGGLTNSAMRFAWLAEALADEHHVVCLDWAGRGDSGWLAHEHDYSAASHVEQLRQFIDHLRTSRGKRGVAVLGSSLGGSAALALAAQSPSRVRQLILNDIGPHLPAARRRRRAETLARFYVFRHPADLVRRIGAAHRDCGPVSDAVRFHLSHHQTRWSEPDGGRIYKHDVRAMQAYQHEAARSLDQWADWRRLRCPALVIHGLRSDALSAATLARMRRVRPYALMEVPHTGHTPVLCEAEQIEGIRAWLKGGDG